jgi:hypothetical protein
MDPWWKIVTPRQEVRAGRSFNPDEFAIALEQVVSGTAPDDYAKPEEFFSRNIFTRALTEHAGMVLRRLSGRTDNTAPVLTLVTQFGGGKTHTLTALYHLAKAGPSAVEYLGVRELLAAAGIDSAPAAQIGVFVGNAWDPKAGHETPWIDIARQLAGDEGVRALGESASSIPPGTEAIGRVFAAAGGTVLLLFDEVLNFLNRHREMAEPFHAFLQNLTVATTGTTRATAVISLPRSQVEMTDWDMEWQERITKVVRRVARDLIANDESEISEVIRRRLFEDLGSDRVRRNVAKAYADWCFERRHQLPAEWMAVDSTLTDAKARERLQERFEATYPFHPATLSVFQRKWQALAQYQQTRGTLAMLAQWIAWAYRDGFTHAQNEPLITLGSAPLDVSDFRSVVLGQLGESRLATAIQADLVGDQAHARALDADTKGPLRNIHRRVGVSIFFESSGGQVEKVAHLPELRFALGEPELDTTSIDTAASALEARSFFVRKIGSDGYRITRNAKIEKVVQDRRASLDEETEVRPLMRELVKKAFEDRAAVPLVFFPADAAAVQDSPRLMIAVLDPESEWTGAEPMRETVAEWSRQRGQSPRLYPAAVIWCAKKPGRELREKAEALLAWRKVQQDSRDGTLGQDVEGADPASIRASVQSAQSDAEEEVWASYRFVVLADRQADGGLHTIDLGAGHSSAAESLSGRVLAALRSGALLNESVAAGYLDRNWPVAFKESGAWPLSSLRQSFLDGSLTRLVDPDRVLRDRIVEFVQRGEFGLAASPNNGTYERLWFDEPFSPDEVGFDGNTYLLTKQKAQSVRQPSQAPEGTEQAAHETPPQPPLPESGQTGVMAKTPLRVTFRIAGDVPPEVWNRLGTRLVTKLRTGSAARFGISLEATVEDSASQALEMELKQIIQDLGLAADLSVERVGDA